MSPKEDLDQQIALTRQLQSLINDMAKSMSSIDSAYTSQTAAVEKLNEAVSKLASQNLDNIKEIKLTEVQKELSETEKSTKDASTRIKELGKQLGNNLPKSASVGAAALDGFKQGLSNIAAIGQGTLSFATGLIDSLFSIGKAIIAIPLSIFSGLVKMAAGAAGGMDELAQAIEKVRENFGALKGPAAGAILDTTKTMKGFSDTGLSTFRIFGNVAEMMTKVMNVAIAMGPTFGVLRKEFVDNGGAILGFQKGLGITDEQMKAFGDNAIAMGKPMSRVMLDVTKQTLGLGKAFDVDQKLIGKDMAKAIADVKHFGGASIKEMGQASVYARKLGVELDKIVGVLDQFETFDQAAESAAKLSQAFGVNVDAFKLMEAQNPAEGIDMLRKSFRDAGVDASSFSRQQLKLLAQQTGLDEATAKSVFSAKNYGVSLDDIKKKSEGADKKTMTQAEAMGKLADSIERMIKSGGSMAGSFFKQFIDGFLGGIQRSSEFRTIMINIQQSLRLVYFEGVRLGQAFVKMFPGVKMFLEGIGDFFKPAKFKALVGGVTDIFINWMHDLSDPNGKASFGSLMTKLQEKFFSFFDGQSSSGKKMLDGFKTIMLTISKIVSEGIKWASDKVGEGIGFVTDLLSGKKKLNTSGAESGLGFFGQIMTPLIEALGHAWKVIWPKVWELLVVVADKIWNFLKSDTFLTPFKSVVPFIAGALFGPALVKSLLAAGASSLLTAGAGLLTGSVGKMFSGLGKKAADLTAAGVPKNIKTAGVAASEAAEGSKVASIEGTLPKGGESQGKIAQELASAGKGISWSDVGKFLVGFAGVVAIGMAAVFTAIAIIKTYNLSSEDIIKGLALVAGSALAMVPAAGAIFLISKIQITNPAMLALGLLAIAAGVTVMVGVAVLAIDAIKNVDQSKLKAMTSTLWEMSKIFGMVSLILLAATGIGAIIISSMGLGAAAMTAGMAAMSAGVAVMVDAALDLIKKLGNMPMGTGLEQKVKIFTQIMDSLGRFAHVIVEMLEAVKPSWITLIKGSDDTTARVAAVSDMIKAMIGTKTTGLMGLIELLVTSMQSLSRGGPQTLESAKVFAELLAATGQLATSLKPPDKLFEAAGGWLSSGEDVAKAINAGTKYVEQVTASLKDLLVIFVNNVMPMVKQGLDDNQLKAASAVGQILTSVVQLVQAMQPSPALMDSLKTTASGPGAALATTMPSALSGLRTIIVATGVTMGEVLPGIMKSMVPVIESLGKLRGFTDTDAKAIGVVGPLLTSMFGMISTLTHNANQIVQNKDIDGAPMKNAKNFLINMEGGISGFMLAIGDSLPMLFKSIKSSISSLATTGDPKALDAGLKTFTGVMSIVSEIPKMLTGIGGSSTSDSKDLAGKGSTMAEVVNQVGLFFLSLVNSFDSKTSSPLKLLSIALADPVFAELATRKTNIETLKAMFSVVNDVIGVVKNTQSATSSSGTESFAVTAYNSIKGVASLFRDLTRDDESPLNMLSASITKVKSFTLPKDGLSGLTAASASMSAFTKSIQADGLAPALVALTSMITSVSTLNALLSDGNLNTVNITAKLGNFAKSVGLGGKSSVTISNKMAQITVNMTVTMNAGELEKVLFMRKNSFVRDRLDYLADNASAGPPILSGKPTYEPSAGAPLALGKSAGGL